MFQDSHLSNDNFSLRSCSILGLNLNINIDTDHICSTLSAQNRWRKDGDAMAPGRGPKDLAARARAAGPVRIRARGVGRDGTDIVARVAHMPGIEIGAISELNLLNAVRAVEIAYGDRDRSADRECSAHLAIEQGRIAVTSDVSDAARERADRTSWSMRPGCRRSGPRSARGDGSASIS